jgi:hypothetical protein
VRRGLAHGYCSGRRRANDENRPVARARGLPGLRREILGRNLSSHVRWWMGRRGEFFSNRSQKVPCTAEQYGATSVHLYSRRRNSRSQPTAAFTNVSPRPPAVRANKRHQSGFVGSSTGSRPTFSNGARVAPNRLQNHLTSSSHGMSWSTCQPSANT